MGTGHKSLETPICNNEDGDAVAAKLGRRPSKTPGDSGASAASESAQRCKRGGDKGKVSGQPLRKEGVVFARGSAS